MNGNNLDLYLYEDSRRADSISIEKGFTAVQLMGQAALSSYLRLTSGAFILSKGSVFIFCGAGNNGGDGLALAYMAAGHNPDLFRRIKIYRTGRSKTDTAVFYEKHLEVLGAAFFEASNFDSSEAGAEDLLIEALLGTGQKAPLSELVVSILNNIREVRSREDHPAYISLDVPAGIAENGLVRFVPPGQSHGHKPEYFSAPDEIHSYGDFKLAVRLHPDLAAYSRHFSFPIGFYPDSKFISAARLLDEDFSRGYFLKSPVSHKYLAGHGLIVGGSRGMEGACLLGADCFFAAGGGILHAFVPAEKSREMITIKKNSLMATSFESGAISDISPAAIAIGNGLSEDDLKKYRSDILNFLKNLTLRRPEMYVILDAGGLELIQDESYPDALRVRTVITPHSGEWKKLGGKPVDCVDSLFAAAALQEKFGCCVLIKDAVSALICPASEKRRFLVQSRPVASLATAGSGDCLTGILLAVLSRKREESIPMSKAIEAALFLHSSSASQAVQPSADDFAGLIKKFLGG